MALILSQLFKIEIWDVNILLSDLTIIRRMALILNQLFKIEIRDVNILLSFLTIIRKMIMSQLFNQDRNMGCKHFTIRSCQSKCDSWKNPEQYSLSRLERSGGMLPQEKMCELR